MRIPFAIPFYSDCVDWDLADLALLEHLCDNEVEITRATFVRHTRVNPQRGWPRQHGWSYFRLPGYRIYWYVNSLIEYVYAEPAELGRLRADLALGLA